MWRTNKLFASQEVPVQWRPLVKVGPNRWLGISKSESWVICGDTELDAAYLTDDKMGSAFLTCLELSFHEFQKRILEAMEQLDPPAIPRPEFPLSEMILAGLATRSDYWVDLALDWLEEAHSSKRLDKPAIKKELSRMLTARKRVRQKTRHRAARIRRQL
ncbi:MAG: hypothetical protein GY720_03205 [bacterium]|nr:hypothetical protein [bacterium]